MIDTIPREKGYNPMQGTNCWDFYNCPKERQETCSAFRLHAGRTCWRVAGTLCGGSVQSVYAMKIGGCQKCDFYIQIKAKQV